jgi:hypothetical protein
LNRTSDLQVSYNFGNPRVSSLRSNVCIIWISLKITMFEQIIFFDSIIWSSSFFSISVNTRVSSLQNGECHLPSLSSSSEVQQNCKFWTNHNCWLGHQIFKCLAIAEISNVLFKKQWVLVRSSSTIFRSSSIMKDQVRLKIWFASSVQILYLLKYCFNSEKNHNKNGLGFEAKSG